MRGHGPSASCVPTGTAHKGTTTYVQELNQPERMSLLGQAPGHLGNAVSRLKAAQGSDLGGAGSLAWSVCKGGLSGTLGETEVPL